VLNGRDMLIIPVVARAFAARGGAMRPSYLANHYTVPHGDGGLVFYREKRKEKRSILIAVLRPRVATHEDTKPERTINHLWTQDAPKFMRKFLTTPGFKANPRGVF
jgi:hypothetical protein